MVSRIIKSSRMLSVTLFLTVVGLIVMGVLWSPRPQPQPEQARAQETSPPPSTPSSPTGPGTEPLITPAMAHGGMTAMICPCDYGGFDMGETCPDPLAGPELIPRVGGPGSGGGCTGCLSPGGGGPGGRTGSSGGGGTVMPPPSTVSSWPNVPGSMPNVATHGRSMVDNMSLAFYHTANDIAAVETGIIGLRRYHRFQDITDIGSFGPATFCNFDVRLKVIESGGTRVVRLFDPRSLRPRITYGANTLTELPDVQDQKFTFHDATEAATFSFNDMTRVRLLTNTRYVYEFELFPGTSNAGATKEGRLIAVRDQNGRGLSVTYQSWTAAQIAESPDRQWQIDTASDYSGRTLTFQYHATQQSGRWVVSQVQASDGFAVTYSYTDGLISQIAFPDGTQSTFGYSHHAPSQCTVVAMFDAAESGVHRQKQVYLSDHSEQTTPPPEVPSGSSGSHGSPDPHGSSGSHGGGTGSHGGGGAHGGSGAPSSLPVAAFAQASQRVRMILDGSGQVSYLNMMIATGGFGRVYYEGGQKLKWLKINAMFAGEFELRELPPGWTFTANGFTNISGASPSDNGAAAGAIVQRYEHASGGGSSVALAELKAGRPTRVISAEGHARDYEYGTNNQAQFIKHSDQTFEAFCYNDLGQITRQRDRLGRVTRTTYDARGNLLTREVGLKESATNVPTGAGGGAGGGEHGQGGSGGGEHGGGGSGEHGGYSDPHGSSGSGSSGTPSSTAGYNPCASDDVQTADYALTTYEYYPEGHVAQFLLKAEINPLGQRTDYEYDTNQRLAKIIEPADTEGGPRAETTQVYDAAGRLHIVTDAEGYETTYYYDSRHRTTKVSYSDASSERFFYGTGADANLLVKQVDRRGIVTTHEYDSSGRRIKTTTAASVMDFAGSETPTTDPSAIVEETLAYVPGTELVVSRTRAGELTEYYYDHMHRVVETRVKPNTATTLASKQTYRGTQLFATEDPYGRKSFHAYDATDGRLIRSIQATVPSITFATPTAVLAATRSAEGTANPSLLITDYLYDAAGQTTSVIDPRGVVSTTQADTRGRTHQSIQAESTVAAGGSPAALPAKSETLYDAASRVIEVRSPRYFDANDTNGVNAAKTVMTHTGRGRVSSRTEAPGTPQAATETYTYNIAGHQISKTDARGHVWQTLRPNCCGRVQLSVDPLGHGTITRTDWNGNVVHQATVADVLSHENTSDPLNAKTLQEVTTKYDLRNRPVARTVWLTPRRAVVFTDPPIAGDDGIAATEGITTRYQYDDNLTDGVGLDQQFSQHLAGLNLGAGCNGSAALVTNPEGERTLSIKDGLGRAVRSVQLDANGAAVVSSTTTHDTVVAVAGYGNVLETSVANALGHISKQRTDGAGRVIQSIDAEGFVTSFEYDANGNRKKVRDPNGVGQDCVYDALNRDVSCSDTQELLSNLARTKTYDLAGNLLGQTDAKGNTTYSYYDARGRRFETKDRNNATTSFTHDAAGNELSMTDAENQTTSYEYDQLGRRTKIVWPDHVANQTPGDAHCGFTTVAYDAAGRAVLKTDQLGETIAFVYDLAGRMLNRQYRSLANSPVGWTPSSVLPPEVQPGPLTDQDTFTYDNSSRMLTAVKGRYSNTVTFTYENGRKTNESLTLFGQTYTVGSSYDAAGRENALTYPDGTQVTRTHTSRGQLASVSLADPNAAASSIATFTYDNGGRETSRLYGNGVETTRAYQADNMLTSIAAANVETLSYTYDENKNPTSETRSGALAAHSWSTGTGPSGSGGFDPQNRLTSWTKTNGDSQQWQLSPVNDWQSFTNNGSTQTRTHGLTHELTSITNAGANTPTALQHDAKGNLTQDDRGCLLTYDADNMLSAFAPNGAESQPGHEDLKLATYHYDALGRRVAKTVTEPSGSTTTTYVLSGQQVISEYSSSGTQSPTLSTRTTHGTYIDEPLVLLSTLNSQPSTVYYHHNRQYSTYTLTDATGAPAERYTYTPYGAATAHNPAGAPTGPTPQTRNRTLFTGRTLDIESALNYFRGRYYSETLGRFTSHDPIEYPDGWNTYAGWFVPQYRDPSGRTPMDQHYGLPGDFWNWYHRSPFYEKGCLSKEDALDLFEDWKNNGKPGPGGGNPHRGGGKGGKGGGGRGGGGGGPRGGRCVGPAMFVGCVLLGGDIGLACDPLGPGTMGDAEYRPRRCPKKCSCAEFSYTRIVPSSWVILGSTETSTSVQVTSWEDQGEMDPLACIDLQRITSVTTETVVGYTIYSVTERRCR